MSKLTRHFIETQYVPAMIGIKDMVDKKETFLREQAESKLKLPRFLNEDPIRGPKYGIQRLKWFNHSMSTSAGESIAWVDDRANSDNRWGTENLLVLVLRFGFSNSDYMKAYNEIKSEVKQYEETLLRDNLAVAYVNKQQASLDKRLAKAEANLLKAKQKAETRTGVDYPYNLYELGDDYYEDEDNAIDPDRNYNEIDVIGHYFDIPLWPARVYYIEGQYESLAEFLKYDWEPTE